MSKIRRGISVELPAAHAANRTCFAKGLDHGKSWLASLDSKETKPLVATAYTAAFSPGSSSPAGIPPYLLFVRDSSLMAQEMDAGNFQLRGEPSRIAETIALDQGFNTADFSVSNNGTLAFNAALYQHELIWMDRAGNRLGAGSACVAAHRDEYREQHAQRVACDGEPHSGHKCLIG